MTPFEVSFAAIQQQFQGAKVPPARRVVFGDEEDLTREMLSLNHRTNALNLCVLDAQFRSVIRRARRFNCPWSRAAVSETICALEHTKVTDAGDARAMRFTLTVIATRLSNASECQPWTLC